MFGWDFVSFVPRSAVSAYLARAWQPIRDEVFSLWEVISSEANHCPATILSVPTPHTMTSIEGRNGPSTEDSMDFPNHFCCITWFLCAVTRQL